MKVGQSFIAQVRTKSGPVNVTVNVVAEGPRDGCAAVMRDLTEGIAKVPRMEGADVSPAKALEDGTVEISWG